MRLPKPPLTSIPELDAWLNILHKEGLEVYPSQVGPYFIDPAKLPNLPANLSDIELVILQSPAIKYITLPKRGNIWGISIYSNFPAITNLLTVYPTINGVKQTKPYTTLDTTNTQFNSSLISHTDIDVAANDYVGVMLDTSAGWTLIGAELTVSLWII